jgi:hypothetical protein
MDWPLENMVGRMFCRLAEKEFQIKSKPQSISN